MLAVRRSVPPLSRAGRVRARTAERVHRRRFHVGRNFLPALAERGLVADTFPHEAGNELAAHLSSDRRTVYAGFDPTAPSLHIGNLIVLNTLLHSARAGHVPVALIGGATAMIGDPSGKESERQRLEESAVSANVKGIAAVLKRVFENHARHFCPDAGKVAEAKIVNNHDWYSSMNATQFGDYVARHFRLGRLLGRKFVRARMESEEGMTLTEFLYQVYQAYDWFHLNREYGCTVQIGGNDQMGNIVAGHDLLSRALDLPVYGLTVPLLLTDRGFKIGKSETLGAQVWLSEEKTSCFDFYQHFLRTKDADVEKMLTTFSFLPMEEIKGICATCQST